MGPQEHSDEMLEEVLNIAGIKATCGTLIHFVMSDEELTERFVRYVQPQFSEEDGPMATRELIVRFLQDTHDVASPGCPEPLGPTGKEEDREG